VPDRATSRRTADGGSLWILKSARGQTVLGMHPYLREVALDRAARTLEQGFEPHPLWARVTGLVDLLRSTGGSKQPPSR
jgi:hypothetical protein